MTSKSPPPTRHIMSADLADELIDRFAPFSRHLAHFSRDNVIKIMHRLKKAHWWFADEHPLGQDLYRLHRCSFEAFVITLGERIGWSQSKCKRAWKAYREWCDRCPRAYVVLLNEAGDRVLCVKGFSRKSKWWFPGGKVECDVIEGAHVSDETIRECARRELIEETGYRGRLSSDCIQIRSGTTLHSYFLCYDVCETTAFQPRS
jgi:mRNA-decapping enzyme subunit 2